jgi:hypothetical protein
VVYLTPIVSRSAIMTPEIQTLFESMPHLALSAWVIWRLFLLIEKMVDALTTTTERAFALAQHGQDGMGVSSESVES